MMTSIHVHALLIHITDVKLSVVQPCYIIECSFDSIAFIVVLAFTMTVRK